MITLTAFRDGRVVRLQHKRHGTYRVTRWAARVSGGQSARLYEREKGKFATADEALLWASDCAFGVSLGDTAHLLGIQAVDLVSAWEHGLVRAIVEPEVIIVPDAERERLRKLIAETP